MAAETVNGTTSRGPWRLVRPAALKPLLFLASLTSLDLRLIHPLTHLPAFVPFPSAGNPSSCRNGGQVLMPRLETAQSTLAGFREKESVPMASEFEEATAPTPPRAQRDREAPHSTDTFEVTPTPLREPFLRLASPRGMPFPIQGSGGHLLWVSSHDARSLGRVCSDIGRNRQE